MKRVVLLEEAGDDLLDAKSFYDRIEPGVGDYCTRSLLTDIERLPMLSGIHAVHCGCYRALGSRFPFGIYYLDEPDNFDELVGEGCLALLDEGAV
jgi:hypothetical protein